ncbi:MAG: radical SAM protein [Phycisphaerae bacterium]
MTFSRKALFMPLNLAICASLVPKDWHIEIIDECATGEPHRPQADCDLVGIGMMTTQAPRGYELADQYRKLGVKVILGGIHPSALPDEATQHADVVAIGEAEATLPHILADYQTGSLKPQYNWRDYPTAEIATPRKDLLNPKDYLVFNPIQTTRGCPHGCAFCTTPAIFGRKFRQRKIENIVEEIRCAKEQFGTNVFIFSDDNFAGNREWAYELCQQLIPLKIKWASQCEILISESDKLLAAMRDSGCIGLILGLESTSPQTLADAGKRFVKADTYTWRIKKIASYNISLWGAFIFGFDHDDWQTCRDTCRFAQRSDLAMACFPILTPYPGTEMFRRYQSQGRILTTDWTKYNGAGVVFQPERFTIQQLRHAQMAAFCEFFHPRSAFRRLKFLPFKKRAWMANLASYFGLSFYMNKKNRHIPQFADFLNPNAPAWNYHEK